MSANAENESSHDRQPVAVTRLPFIQRLLIRLLNLPRIVRIVIAAIMALLVAFVVTLVLFYDSLFFSNDLEAIFAIIVVVCGLGMYLAGWALIVGTVGEKPPLRPAIVWYFGIGLVSLVLMVLWLIQAAALGGDVV